MQYLIVDNGEEHEVSQQDYDLLIEADLIYYCDECSVAHAVDDWSSVQNFLEREQR